MKRFIADTPEQTGSGLRKRDDVNMYSMLLTLARENCFDETGCILTESGEPVHDTHVAKLVSYACRPERLLTGIREFVSILKKVGITEVPNENLMMMSTGRVVTPRSPSAVSAAPTAATAATAPPVVAPMVAPTDPPTVAPEMQPLPERPPSKAVKRKGGTPVRRSVKPKIQKTATWQLRSRK